MIRSTLIWSALVLIFWLIPNNVQANDPILADKDKVVVHLDKSFYVTGEIIWYKLYLPAIFKGKKFSIKTTIVHNGNLVDYYFHKTEGKTYVEGYYKIPFDLATSIYQFTFTGIDESDSGVIKFTEVQIPIYNDLEEIKPANLPKLVEQNNNPIALPFANDLQLSIDLDKASFGNRENIKASISVKDKAGNPVKANLSVAVRDWTLTGAEVLNRPTVILSKGEFPASTVIGGRVVHLVDLKLKNSIFTKATLTDANNNPIQANVLGVYSRDNNSFNYTKADKNGNIFLEEADFYDRKNIQFVGYEKEVEDIKIKLKHDLSTDASEKIIYTKGILEYMNWSRQRKKIFQMFTTFESNLESKIPKTPQMKEIPGVEYRIKDYKRFKNLAVFFKEILAPLKFKQLKDGTYTAKMYNPKSKTFKVEYDGIPLFVIDGKMTKDGNFVANLDIDKIETVRLISNPKVLRSQFNILGADGVTFIKTSYENLEIPANDADDIFNINGILAPADFPAFDAKTVANNRQPFFRPQLYWNPNVVTDPNGRAEINFMQSDAIGTFLIEVVVQTEDGKLGTIQKKYQVVY